MASMTFQRDDSSIPSSSTAPRWQYDVFLSFRGEDTREKFIDHLSTWLDLKGVITFKDDKKLKRGKAISSELLKAIAESRFSIVVLSENYASSEWCLDELVKILECKNGTGHTIYPVFYHVHPSEVRKLEGKFGEGFEELKSKNEMEKVQKWREALQEVANLSGWPFPSAKHRFESKFVQEIVHEIFLNLNYKYASANQDLVGMGSRVEEVITLLDLSSEDVLVHLVGIWGMGGIGKTTSARAVFDRISHHFEDRSFLENVRELSTKSAIVTSQQRLISDVLMEKILEVIDTFTGISMETDRACHKRVLIVLDDVNQLKQVEMLVGKHDWFGFGSRIIITSRDKHLLTACGVNHTYEVEMSDEYDAVKLSISKAFGKDQQKGVFEGLLDRAIEYARGIPLVRNILGFSLNGRNKCKRENALSTIKERPNKEVIEVLKLSDDALERDEKEILFDSAYFLKGVDKDLATERLDRWDFHPDIGISLPVEKSLITVTDGRMGDDVTSMPDLIEEFEWDIVHRESKEPGMRSRL